MGGLIMTKGTRRLKNHYNEEFSTWIAFYRQPDIVTIFDRGNTDISIWKDVVNYITDPNSPANGHTSDPEDPTLLPQKDPGHKHLRRRWKFFLEKILTQANQNLLADKVHAALTDKKNVVYIAFDVVQDKNQTVTLDFSKDGTQDIANITLKVVDAMPEHPTTPGGDDPPEIDPQT